jgi:catechol 2,3-dioxygenase-like lactoylglutathione lyase family enzyme
VIKTRGITHVALSVRDPARASRFYRSVFGMKVVYRSRDFVQLQTPGSHDVLVLERSPGNAGRRGGVAHFGFRLIEPDDIDAAARAVERAGGRVLSRGEFVPGEPYLFAEDPEGYEVEIWYELPTPVDPPATEGRRRGTRSKNGRKRR